MPLLYHDHPPAALGRQPCWVSALMQWERYKYGRLRLRGVAWHPSGRWEACLRVPSYSRTYVGRFDTDISAAAAYDMALVRLKGFTANTNFLVHQYGPELAEHSTLRRALRQNAPWAAAVMAGETSAFGRWIREGIADFPERWLLG